MSYTARAKSWLDKGEFELADIDHAIGRLRFRLAWDKHLSQELIEDLEGAIAALSTALDEDLSISDNQQEGSRPAHPMGDQVNELDTLLDSSPLGSGIEVEAERLYGSEKAARFQELLSTVGSASSIS